jgi:hypothetical protein
MDASKKLVQGALVLLRRAPPERKRQHDALLPGVAGPADLEAEMIVPPVYNPIIELESHEAATAPGLISGAVKK